MPKLSKTRSFTVSNETITVDFKGTSCECANLLKSGIMNQTTILVAYEDKWHEINVLDLGGDDTNLEAFKNFVETMKLKLSDLGITTVEQEKSNVLTHEDFMSLSEKFPPHDYIAISLLNDYNVKSGGKASVDELNDWLKVCQRDGITINELIQKRESEKQKSLMKTDNFDEPMDLEVGPDNQTAIPVETITVVAPEVVENTVTILDTPPAQVKKPISLQVFETLTPERISELQGLNDKQIEIVKKNPIVQITDKTSYELAKKTAATLLKASTDIDGAKGIEATATKYLNTFKTMLKNALGPIALITREPYDKQKTIISTWENAEEIRLQAEQRAKLAKIKLRTDELFAVPFTFNGSIYSIGTVYCTPSQVETVSDEDFKIIVENGKVIKTALDAEALVQSAKDLKIAELEAKLAKLEALENMSNTEPEAVSPANVPVNNSQPVNTVPATQSVPTQPINTAAAYVLPPQENVLLNRIDLENVEHLEKPAYQKCRSYYVRGLKDVAGLIEGIMNDDTPNTIKKSERITNLCVILKKSE
jgi:hypothetical protein